MYNRSVDEKMRGCWLRDVSSSIVYSVSKEKKKKDI